MWNKGTEANAELASFYHFWAWQYVQRNPSFLKLVSWAGRGLEVFLNPAVGDELSSFLVECGAKQPNARYDPLVTDAGLLRAYAESRFGFPPEGPFGRAYTSEELICAIAKGETIERPLGKRSFPRLVEPLAFRTVEDGAKVVEFGGERIEGRDLLVAVSLDMPVKAVIAELEDLLKAYRYQDRFERGVSNEAVDYDNSAEAQRIRKSDDIAFRSSKEGARALGLWLWDYLNERDGLHDRGERAEAVRAMKEKHVPAAMGYYVSEDEVYFRWIRQTIKCVDAGEVYTVG